MEQLDPIIEQINDARRSYLVYVKRGDKEMAQKVVDEILQRFGDHPNALEAKADWLLEQGQRKNAQELYKQIIDSHPGRVETEKKYADLIFFDRNLQRDATAYLQGDSFSNLMQQQGTERNPTTAGLLSFLIPGMGQVYSGALSRGVWLFLWALASWIALFAVGTTTIGRGGLTTIGVLSIGSILVCTIVSVLDAVMHCPRAEKIQKKERPPPPYNLPFE